MAAEFPTEGDMEVASILLELPTLILESIRQQPFEIRSWNKKGRRTEPKYQFKPEPEQDEPTGPTSANESKKIDKPESSATPAKRVKKKKSKKKLLEERKAEVASLTKENEDLKRELQELNEKCENLITMNSHMKDQCAEQFKQERPIQLTKRSTIVLKIKLTPPPPPLVESATENQRQKNLAECVMETPLTCQIDRVEKDAKSAYARKRRLEILRDKGIYKRSRLD